MKRAAICISCGLLFGFIGSLVVSFVIGNIYAEELHWLIPQSVNDAALTVANRIQGYE